MLAKFRHCLSHSRSTANFVTAYLILVDAFFAGTVGDQEMLHCGSSTDDHLQCTRGVYIRNNGRLDSSIPHSLDARPIRKPVFFRGEPLAAHICLKLKSCNVTTENKASNDCVWSVSYAMEKMRNGRLLINSILKK